MNIFKSIVLLVIILFIGCNKRESTLDYEKNVMNQIFSDLIDSLYYDLRTEPLVFPPPPAGVYISEDIRKKNKLSFEKMRQEHELNKQKILNDTSRILIIVHDTVSKYTDQNNKYLENIVFLNDTSSMNLEYVIDLSKFSENKKHLFSYRSKFPNVRGRQFYRELRKNPPLNHFGAVVGFSKISFDKEKNHGVLSAGISYGILNGSGFIIYIKKDNDKWIIDKIFPTWIS